MPQKCHNLQTFPFLFIKSVEKTLYVVQVKNMQKSNKNKIFEFWFFNDTIFALGAKKHSCIGRDYSYEHNTEESPDCNGAT